MPAKPISAANAEHYTWVDLNGTDCDGWHLVRNSNLNIIEELMPPGTSETRHHHAHAHQFFYVLQGELSIEVEHQDHVLQPGQGLEIAQGQSHQVVNRSSRPVRFLVTSQPPSHGDRINS
jgi:mannose-6-phosphate isomerase-like protein (cupin superfamily)